VKSELEERLRNKWGTLLGAGRSGGTAYIETGDGWYNLIDSLLATIQSRVDSQRYMRQPDEPEPFAPVVTEIKEKWGGLRVHVEGGDDFVWGAIVTAETASHKICEICGCPGVKRHSSWVMTLCEKHASMKQGTVTETPTQIDYEGGSNDRS